MFTAFMLGGCRSAIRRSQLHRKFHRHFSSKSGHLGAPAAGRRRPAPLRSLQSAAHTLSASPFRGADVKRRNVFRHAICGAWQAGPCPRDHPPAAVIAIARARGAGTSFEVPARLPDSPSGARSMHEEGNLAGRKFGLFRLCAGRVTRTLPYGCDSANVLGGVVGSSHHWTVQWAPAAERGRNRPSSPARGGTEHGRLPTLLPSAR
jgi:hypothetical protein